jgi:hypothetical protein
MFRAARDASSILAIYLFTSAEASALEPARPTAASTFANGTLSVSSAGSTNPVQAFRRACKVAAD